MISEQSLIVEFAGAEAVTSLAELLKDPVDRYRALNFLLDVAGPIDQMDPATIAMFKRFQAALLTLAREWRDPEFERSPATPVDAAVPASAAAPLSPISEESAA
jgi:hypothetical protein